jgi:serine/threonine protein kinase
LIGRTIVGHRVERLLGEGGMGVVYQARHEQLGRLRALKLLPPQLARDEAFRERFEREWRLAAAIEHPNIVEVLDAGEADERLYIVMRLIDGPDLAKLVASEGPLVPERALALLEQIGAALDAAHSQQLVHRDVTPRNILVGAGDHAFLADFGVAKTTTTKGLTRTGFFVGNLDYAAPEQIEGKPIDGRADVYALGGVLYTCLTGQAPYTRDSDVQLMYAQLNEPPPVPSAIRADLPAAVDDVVAKAMAKSPGDRYESCSEFMLALQAALRPPAQKTVLADDEARSTVVPPDFVETAGRAGNGAPGKVRMPPLGRLAEGDLVGEFRIERRIGQGGMGVVYLAERPRLGGKVALKILSDELAADERFRDRFVRESQMASALDHPNIIPVYDAGVADGIFYISMRYVDGPSLKTLLEQEAPLEPMRAMSLLAQVGSALDIAHEHGLVHRDVKPANILVTKGGASDFGEHIYLTDFGVSKRVESHSGLTGTGQFIGTLSYAAPEQIEGKSVDRRADVYALGCVLYESLVGLKPFERENDVAVLWAHVTEPPPRPSDHRGDLPTALDAVIQRALAKSPGERYPTCHELVADARAAFSSSTAAVAVPVTTIDRPAAAATRLVPPEKTHLQTVVPASQGSSSTASVAQSTADSEGDAAAVIPAAGETLRELESPAAATAEQAVPEHRAQPPERTKRKRIVAVVLVLCVASAAVGLGVTRLGSSGSHRSGTVPPAKTVPLTKVVPKLQVKGFDIGKAVAGKPLAVRLAVAQTGSAGPLAGLNMACKAKLDGQPIPGTHSFSHGLATCSWQLPPRDTVAKLVGTIRVVHGGLSVSRPFSVPVSRTPLKLVLAEKPSFGTPQPGAAFVASFPFKFVDEAGRARSPSQSKIGASCRAQVSGSRFTSAKAIVSTRAVACTWPVPANAAGRELVMLLEIHSGLYKARRMLRTRVAAPVQPPPIYTSPSTPPNPPPPPPPPTVPISP